MSDTVRNVLLRALFEPDFHNQLLTNPKEALSGYSLTDEEQRALLSPSKDLYALIAPAAGGRQLPGRFLAGAEPPTVIAVIIVVAITAFVTAIAASNPRGIDLQALQPLVSAIRASEGQERMNLITTLVHELTREA